jgi:hypothetical protein
MDTFNLEPPPVPFRVETKPPQKRSFSMRGIQGSKAAEAAQKRFTLPLVV